MSGPNSSTQLQRQGRYGYLNGQQSQSSYGNSLSDVNLWCWLVDLGVLKSEIDRKPTKFLLDGHKQKSSRTSKQKSNMNYKNRDHGPSINSQI